VSVVQSLSVQQAALREKDLAIADPQSKLEESSTMRRETAEKLAKLQLDLDQELAILRG